MNHLARLSEQINDWFFTKAHGMSPANSVVIIADSFEGALSSKGFQLNTHFKLFRNNLCDATCTMYRAHLENKDVEGPKKIANLPKGWSDDLEDIWSDYIYSRTLTDDFWSEFWYEIPEGSWEAQFPQFRSFIQAVLPIYIQRDLEMLIEESLVAKNNEGEYVDIYDPEYEEEERDERDY